jgi:integrase
MATQGRRSNNSGGVSFEHRGGAAACRDKFHRRCAGRWVGEIITGQNVNGNPIRRKVNAATKGECEDRLEELKADLATGITKRSPARYTVRKAVEDYLAEGRADVVAKTIIKDRGNLEHLLRVIGAIKLRELTTTDVDRALKVMAGKAATSTVRHAHAALKRAINHAASRDLVARNVAAFTKAPTGQEGRPSKSLTLEQWAALWLAAQGDTRMLAYTALSVGTGMRTEEVRALRWDHVELDAKPPHVQVWRSVRARGEVKTQTSRRTLALPELAVTALQAHKAAGNLGELVFITRNGLPMDAGNVRKQLRRLLKTAGIPPQDWTTRELRHTGISLLSLGGLPIEEVARIAGHASTRTTETVYRRELRPVITAGAATLDRLLAQAASSSGSEASSASS